MKNNKFLKWVVGFSSVAMFTGFIGLTQKSDVTNDQQVSLNNSNQQGTQSDNTEQNPYVQENPSWGEGYSEGNINQGRGFHNNDAYSQENPSWGGDYENGSDQSESGNNRSDSNQSQFGNNSGSEDGNRVSGRAS